MHRFLVALATAIAISAIMAPVLAQQPVDGKTKEELKKVDPVPPATAPKLSEQAGTTEPSAKVEGTNSNPNAVFENGVLTVPGALTDVDTAPAKHWARTNADDQIPIAGHRLKNITAEQLRHISQELLSQRNAPSTSPVEGNFAVIGAEIPAPVAFEALIPVPDTLSTRFAELRGTAYLRSAGKIVIVDRDNNIVVGVLEG
jgi:hypothetical protein